MGCTTSKPDDKQMISREGSNPPVTTNGDEGSERQKDKGKSHEAHQGESDKHKSDKKGTKTNDLVSSGSSHTKPGDKTTTVLGKYEVIKGKSGTLGEGSFSVVQKGWNIHTDEEVAVKTYKVDKNDKEEFTLAMKKFNRQITVLKRLAKPMTESECSNPRLWHPKFKELDVQSCFLKLIDYSKKADGQPGPDVSDGQLYVITEVGDFSLKDLLTDQRTKGVPIVNEQRSSIARSVVTVVAALHAKGLVHLDIKPENLMRVGDNWKLIDVDGCSEINSLVNINDSSISFSPCYCAPEWARFLIEDSDNLKVQDGLDVWSVGISIAELVHLDACLKPKYASIFKEYGSHRKAGFCFLEWLSKPNEPLSLPASIAKASPEFRDLVVDKILNKDPTQRVTLAECLDHPALSVSDAEALNNEMRKQMDAIAQKRAQRLQEEISDKPPLYKSVLYKLNLGGDLKNHEHWLKRDMWLAHNGSLCYFSSKQQQRLVYLDYKLLCRAKVSEIKDAAYEYAFEVSYPTTTDESDVTDYETARFATETKQERDAWTKHMELVRGLEYQQLATLKISRGLVNDFRDFKLQVRNRRQEINAETKEFLPKYKAKLFKLNQDGDWNNREHWLEREMWIASNGSLCYHSKKEDRELQYYTKEDMSAVETEKLPDGKTCMPFAFEIRLPPKDGLEFAPGVFAAESEESREEWIKQIQIGFSRRSAAALKFVS